MNGTGRDKDGLSATAETALAELLREAGPPPRLDDREVADVRATARAAWRRRLATQEESQRHGGRSPMRFSWAVALAAAAVLTALAVWRFMPELFVADEAPVVARLESSRGFVEIDLGEENPSGEQASSGAELRSGHRLQTGSDGHAALRLGPGSIQVRLDSDTSLRLLSDDRVELERGAVYVDTGTEDTGSDAGAVTGPAGAATIEVLTALGLVQDIGTRFEIRWSPEDEALRLRVRDGEVRFTPDDGSQLKTSESASAGTELAVYSDGQVTRSDAEVHGATWDWVVRAAPPFDLEGRSLDEFLRWLEGESNLSIRFLDPALADESRRVILHGSIEGLTPTEALRLVLLGSGLRAEFADTKTTGVVRIAADAG